LGYSRAGVNRIDANRHCCSNIVHPPGLGALSNRGENAHRAAIHGYRLVHRSRDLDGREHGTITGAPRRLGATSLSELPWDGGERFGDRSDAFPRVPSLSGPDDEILRELSGDLESPAHLFERPDQKFTEMWKEPARSRKVAVSLRIYDLKSLLSQNF
jgi:hypothetical protein